MKASPWAAFTALFLAALCAFAPGLASAQARDVYAVSGVYVDETAANAAAAQQAGFAAAYRLGFERLVRRLTQPAEIAARGAPAADAQALERMVLSVDVEEERRSATRYIGRLTVRFNPELVRAHLSQQGFSIVDARAAAVMVAPVSVAGAPEETAALWREVWTRGGFGNELVPVEVAPAELQGAPAWDAAAPFAQQSGTTTALFAILRVQGATATAQLVEVNANARRDRGEVAARIQGSDDAALRAALASLADQASTQLQNEWKARAVTSSSAQRGRISASALYSDQRQWERIKQALEAAAQTLVSEIRIEAVGRDGALVSFSFTGDEGQLAAELGRRGVRLENGAMGPTLRVAGR
ncbi:MAG: hypothetical protein KJZ75_02715 [Hyphomonadaceae bacterium]|nr:hypothetical protein [Hyphomonadaceae bacterium]GIK49552.1 MAG: hypothetical protein BroJett013_22490 [Alphaproteobacteria bacterium]